MSVRFGELDSKSAIFISQLSALSASEFATLLLQLSTLSVDENGVKIAKELLAEKVLKIRFGQLDERLTSLISSLLALRPEDLELLLLQLAQLSVEELLVLTTQLERNTGEVQE